jgi:hypothetical protein
MHANFRVFVVCAIAAALFLIPAVAAAQAAGDNSQATPAVQPSTTPDSQAVSQTGLFPVFAVDMNFKASHVDGTAVPSSSPNNGVDSAFQSAWDAIKSGGFNTIVFRVDLKDPQAAARVANVCIWAKASNVSVIPVLANASADSAGAFPAAIVSRLRGGDGQQFGAYTQISYFQLQNPVPAANLTLAEAQKKQLEAVDALRNAESQALDGTGVQSTPIMVTVSFDYELVRQGAIAGVPLDAAAEQKALDSLKKFVQPYAAAANVNAVSVTWFPRSITSGDEGHFASLLREVEGALPGKKLLLDTGFSTAFNSADQQNQFLTVALTNLAGVRANEGADGGFLGVTIFQAVSNSNATARAPAGTADPAQWNWNEKAKQLARMWSQGGQSPELTWWLEKVRGSRGLLGQDMTPSPALQAVQQFSATVAQVSQTMAPPAAADTGGQPVASAVATPSASGDVGNPAAPAAAAQPAGASSPSFYQQMLQTLVQQVTTQLTTALVTKLTNKLTNSSPAQGYPAQGNGIAYTQNPNYPATSTGSPAPSSFGVISLSPQDVTVDTVSATTGQTVHITAQLHNGSADQDFSGLTVQLVDSANPASPGQTQAGVAVQRAGVVPVQLTWTAGQSTPSLMIQVMDSTGTQMATAPVPAITIANAGLAANTTPSSSNSGSQTGVSQPGQSFAPSNTSATTSGSDNGSQAATNQSGQDSQSGNAGNSSGTTTGAASDGSNSGQAQPGQGGSSTTQTGIAVIPVRPQIVFFGPATVIGPTQALSLQVTNPAGTVMRSAQAQLFVDGKPAAVQPLGPFLPNQTRSTSFARPAVSPGNHQIKIVVTTSEGANATAVASPASSPVQTVSVRGSQPRVGLVQAGPPVRSGLPVAYRIGTVATAPVAPPAMTPQAVSPQTASTRTVALPGPVRSTPVGVATVVPPARATLSSTTTTTTVTPQTSSTQTAGVRMVPQGSVRSTPVTVATVVPPARPTPAATTVTPPATSGVRTVVPQTANANQPGATTTVLPPNSAGQTAGVRTIAPQGGTYLSSTATTIHPPGTTQPGTQIARPGMQGYVDLSVSPGDIRFRPAAPGQPLACTVLIHNLGTVATQGASVVFTLNADGRIMSSRPTPLSIAARGSFVASWTAPMPAAQNVQLGVQVMANGDANSANNQAVIRVH